MKWRKKEKKIFIYSKLKLILNIDILLDCELLFIIWINFSPAKLTLYFPELCPVLTACLNSQCSLAQVDQHLKSQKY